MAERLEQRVATGLIAERIDAQRHAVPL